MNPESVRDLLERLRRGEVTVNETMEALRLLPVRELGFAQVDTHRAIRCGFHEVIFCQGKTPEQVVRIVEAILKGDGVVLATRASREIYEAVRGRWPDATYHELARAITINVKHRTPPVGCILIVTGGTADIPVAEEARVTAEVMNNRVETLYDVGVAGIHRLLRHADRIARANVIIAVAGMEGALASVVGGLASRPVIAVPTSVGYGTSFGGIAPLLTMLNSCAAGISVVNIDNGFGAGYVASLINQTNLKGDSECPEAKK